MDPEHHADPALAEMVERLTGRWRVTGPGIEGEAEYRAVDGGRLLVLDVDFVVDGQRIKNIQQIGHDPETGSLRSRYLDTAGAAASYTWTLDGRTLRVTKADGTGPDGSFVATFADDDSSYSGTWHSPADEGADQGADEEPIVYTRVT